MSAITQIGSCTNANFPRDADGRVYHLGVKEGMVANRILTCGDTGRARLLASLPGFEIKFDNTSPRNFTIITGIYKGVPMSIIASQMGFPNMDFVIRECRAIVEGPMHIVRLGTCGCPRPDVPVGSVVTADDGTVAIIRNPDGFFPDATPEDVAGRYIFTRPILPDAALQSLVSAEIDASLESEGKGTMHVGGVNASADTFYASQGRQDDNFRDENETLVDDLVAKYPTICAIEMETHQLFSLAQVSAEHARIFAAGAAIVLAQRRSNDFLTNDRKHELEHTLGLACLEALAKVESTTPVPTSAVWL